MPKRNGTQGPDDLWYMADTTTLASGFRPYFVNVQLNLSPAMRSQTAISVELHADPVTNTTPPTPVTVALTTPAAIGVTRPSDVFGCEACDNTKPAMTRSIVTRDVVVAGFLVMTERGASGAAPNEDEDMGYTISLDSDFIRRNYVAGGRVLEPLASAVMKGNSSFGFGGPSVSVPFVIGNTVDAGNFLLATADTFWAELNSWHVKDRGQAPFGWVADPNPAKSGNRWAWLPDAPSGGPPLQTGDYVVISGTLWQDTGKLTGVNRNNGDAETARKFCWNDSKDGYAGWLEIHPPDSVRFVDPGPARPGDPVRRKDLAMRSLCGAVQPAMDEQIQPPTPPPTQQSVLKFETLIDSRFTAATLPHTEAVEPNCPDRLRVTATLRQLDTFKAVYLMWWEEGTQPRQSCGTPASPPPPPPPSAMTPRKAECLDECSELLAACSSSQAQCQQRDTACRVSCR
ncbi:MAG: hypothetical protein NTV70_10355 [Acidobacteria bacterium]|nr:hypothetical protein [Acidobacteriota bacterium]